MEFQRTDTGEDWTLLWGLTRLSRQRLAEAVGVQARGPAPGREGLREHLGGGDSCAGLWWRPGAGQAPAKQRWRGRCRSRLSWRQVLCVMWALGKGTHAFQHVPHQVDTRPRSFSLGDSAGVTIPISQSGKWRLAKVTEVMGRGSAGSVELCSCQAAPPYPEPSF